MLAAQTNLEREREREREREIMLASAGANKGIVFGGDRPPSEKKTSPCYAGGLAGGGGHVVRHHLCLNFG